MRRRVFALIPVILLLAVAQPQSGCGDKFGRKNVPQLSVRVEGKTELQAAEFPPLPPGQGKSTLQIVVSNAGTEDLLVNSVGLDAGGNRYIRIEWTSGTYDFPFEIRSGEELDLVRFQLVYQPQDPPDFSSSTLLITSNDEDKAEYRLVLTPPQKAPRIQVSPSSFTFLNATCAKAEEQIFEVMNVGTDTLVVLSVPDLKSPNPNFTPFDTPAPGATVRAPTEVPNDKVTFKVRYRPCDSSAPPSAVVVIRTNDPSQPDTNIQLKGKLRPGKLVVTYADQVRGYLDFSEVVSPGAQLRKEVNLFNEGPGPIRILGGSAEPDDGDGSYALFIRKGADPEEPFTHKDVRAIRAQEALDVIVEYTAPQGDGADRDLVIRYENPFPSEVLLPMIGGNPKPRLIVYPAQPLAASYLQFHTETAPKERTLVLANEGTAPVEVKDMTFSLPPGFEDQPLNFDLVDPPALPLTVQPLSIVPVTLRFKAEGDPIISKANLEITYVDAAGADSLWNVALAGYRQPDAGILLPTAKAKVLTDFGTPTVGSDVVLSGEDSLPGDAHISSSGYSWYVVEKPPSSALKLDAISGPTTSFIPDQAGRYAFAVFVQTVAVTKGDGTKFGNADYPNLWSDEITLEVQVQPAP